MSFHEDMFHETKRERKFYEKRKQEALEEISELIGHINSYEEIQRLPRRNEINNIVTLLERISRLVNKI